jgi:hypothetical protein
MFSAYHDNPNFSLFANGLMIGPDIKIFPESWDKHNIVSPPLFHVEMLQAPPPSLHAKIHPHIMLMPIIS